MASDLDEIFCLEAGCPRAENAFKLAHNSAFLVDPDLELADLSREATPATECSWDANFASRLKFSFRVPPKSPCRGYTFGSSRRFSDILLGSSHQSVSATQFTIMIDRLGNLILQDHSRSMTVVSYNGQLLDQKRTHFRWILFPGYDITITTAEPRNRKTGGLTCKLEVPTLTPARIARLQQFACDFIADDSLLNDFKNLHTYSQASTSGVSSRVDERGQRPLYIDRRWIGSGSYGRVFESWDVSTGCSYASKYFHDHHSSEQLTYWREVYLLSQVSHASVPSSSSSILIFDRLIGESRPLYRLGAGAQTPPSHGIL